MAVGMIHVNTGIQMELGRTGVGLVTNRYYVIILIGKTWRWLWV